MWGGGLWWDLRGFFFRFLENKFFGLKSSSSNFILFFTKKARLFYQTKKKSQKNQFGRE